MRFRLRRTFLRLCAPRVVDKMEDQMVDAPRFRHRHQCLALDHWLVYRLVDWLFLPNRHPIDFVKHILVPEILNWNPFYFIAISVEDFSIASQENPIVAIVKLYFHRIHLTVLLYAQFYVVCFMDYLQEI